MEPIQQLLRSRKIVCENFNEVKDIHVEQKWKEIWEEASVFGNEMIINPVMKVAGTNLHRKLWVTLNRLRTHQGRLFKWGVIDEFIKTLLTLNSEK